MDPMTLAAAPDPSLPVITHFIDGRPRASSRPLFENRDPTTGMVTSLVHEADAAAVDEAVSAARRALHGPWAGFTDAQRADAMRRIAEGVRSRFDEFLAAEIRDTGKPSAMASHLAIPRGAANLDVSADQIAHTPPPARTGVGWGKRGSIRVD